MFLASLTHLDAAKVTRGGFHDRPIIHIDLGALKLTCSVEDARELAKTLQTAVMACQFDEALDEALKPLDNILRGNADLVPAEHATLSPAQSADFEARR